ncbi:hypothetical protein DEU56DRAFT_127304 [Suillus clintonianus]|uniref:uncharacterized protein n=1 Tax=Suillus clintonianus TaxID=1904413 RepID=UPI001B86FD48|nr:uncharacterized protein DEU56DRAFT_127304 [Suillus clintonianus]KAG2147545.1 hypothetical protein DEU56DRAFT_127304 [Suillus clintonianus]
MLRIPRLLSSALAEGMSTQHCGYVRVKKAPAYDFKPTSPRTPSTRVKVPFFYHRGKNKTEVPALSVSSPQKIPPSKPRVLPATTNKAVTHIEQPKISQGTQAASSSKTSTSGSIETAAKSVSLSTPAFPTPKQEETQTKPKPIHMHACRIFSFAIASSRI